VTCATRYYWVAISGMIAMRATTNDRLALRRRAAQRDRTKDEHRLTDVPMIAGASAKGFPAAYAA
jgi:hypothetical protein